MFDEAELIFEDETVNRTVERVVNVVAPDALPDDCIFGDGGAYALLSPSTATEQPGSSTDKKKPKISSHTGAQVLQSLSSTETFASMLEQADRSFTIGDTSCTVEISRSVSLLSTSTVATVFDTDRHKLGYISTAAPLGTTNGLKATCSVHKDKGMPPCSCWITFPKSKTVSPEDRLALFKDLCTWIAEGKSANRETHSEQSWVLRVAAGMKPRRSKAASLGDCNSALQLYNLSFLVSCKISNCPVTS